LEEKAEIENQLEAEQEYIVNRLNRQLAEARSEKCELESQLSAQKLVSAERVILQMEKETETEPLPDEHNISQVQSVDHATTTVQEIGPYHGELIRHLSEDISRVERLEKFVISFSSGHGVPIDFLTDCNYHLGEEIKSEIPATNESWFDLMRHFVSNVMSKLEKTTA